MSSLNKDDEFEYVSNAEEANYGSQENIQTCYSNVFVPNRKTSQSEISNITSTTSDKYDYRNKLKDRFEMVKKQAGQSILKTHSFKPTAEKVKYIKRAANLIKKENKETELHLKTRERNVKTFLGIEISKLDLYNFFCYENYTNKLITRSDTVCTKAGDTVINIDEHCSNDDAIISEKNLFWTSFMNQTVMDKNFTEKLMLDSILIRSKHKMNLLGQRFSHSEKEWFNSQGNLQLLLNPYTYVSYKPCNNKTNGFHSKYNSTKINSCNTLPEKFKLNIKLISLKFFHHPLFSKEHVLQQKLVEYYDMYTNNLDKLTDMYSALEDKRNIYKKMKKELLSSVAKNKNVLEIIQFSNYIKSLRETYFDAAKQNKNLLKNILKTWRIIKDTRKTNGYSNTSIKLGIKKEVCNYDVEKKEWDLKIKDVCDEITYELECQFQMDICNYTNKYKEWKENRKHNENNSEKKPIKPTKNYDHAIIEKKVEQNFKDSFKTPNDPNLSLSLSYANEITGNVTENKEKMRRNTVSSTKFKFHLFINNIELCTSNVTDLTQQFSCCVNENVSLELQTIPDVLILKIHELPETMMEREIAEIKINTQSDNPNVHDNIFKLATFLKHEIIHYKHEGVGSGVQIDKLLPDCPNSYEILNTSGEINYEFHCTPSNISSIDSYEKQCKSNFDSNIASISEKQDIVEYEAISNVSTDCFRLSSINFCNMEVIERNARFRVLTLRNQNEPSYMGLVVPTNSKRMQINVLYSGKDQPFEEDNNEINDYIATCDDNIQIKRLYGKTTLNDAYLKIFQITKNFKNNLCYENMIDEKIVFHIESFFQYLIPRITNWFKSQYFFILPKKLESVIPDTKLKNCMLIIINIKSAINVPIRNSKFWKLNNMHRFNVINSSKYFIKARYKNVEVRSSAVDGDNPTWNTELCIPLELTHVDYTSPSSLNGSIVLGLFDEVEFQYCMTNGTLCNWLGCIEIPLSALTTKEKMEGMFKVQKPVTTFGYQEDARTQKVNSLNTTYLHLSAAIRPNVTKLTPSMTELGSTELPHIKNYILNWNETYNKNYPDRKFSAMAINLNGETVCITRYIQSLEPPQMNINNFQVTAEQCAAYVSMIPFSNCNHFYQNVWLSTEQLLTLMNGSVIDHAVALTCYLKSLEIDAWLLLGYGIPHGSSAYVLLKEYVSESNTSLYYVYDASTAMKYNLLYEFCPLKSIFCVVNEKNIWANTQYNDISQTRFDFNRKGDWLPLFNNQNPAPSNSFQKILHYLPTPDVKQLEIQLDKLIRKKISKLRMKDKTSWNYKAVNNLKSLISKYNASTISVQANLETFSVLNDAQNCSINGYIFKMPYITTDNVIEHVLSTDSHLISGVDIEFALAVQVHAYPNHVLAVWICLATFVNEGSI